MCHSELDSESNALEKECRLGFQPNSVNPHPNPPQAGEGDSKLVGKSKCRLGIPAQQVKTCTPAFTLAEVLITLGIIGVVAAITIPGLMTSYKAHQLRAKFLKSYSVINQVFKQMESDDVSLDPSTYVNTVENKNGRFYQTFRNYLAGVYDCGDLTTLKRTSICFDTSSTNSSKGYKTLDGNSNLANSRFDDGQLVLQDGTSIFFENPSNVTTGAPLWIIVDLNGYNTKPNRLGYDTFIFEFVDGGLKTMGEGNLYKGQVQKYCDLNEKGPASGVTCATRAKNDTEYFKWAVKNIK